MTEAPPTIDTQRRKQVRLRLRPDLVFSEQRHEGRVYYIVKDPISLRYLRFNEHERFLLDLMDGLHTLEEAQQAFERRFRPERLPLEEVEAFASELLEAGLVHNESPQAGVLLLERARRRHRRAWWTRLLNVLAIKIPLLDPDRLLAQMLPAVRFLFRPWFLAVCLGGLLTALALLATHWNDFLGRLPAYRDFFTPQTLLFLWMTLGLVKIAHELGHGLSCKAFGGEVHEMGVLLLLFFPCLFCNVSDAVTLPSKWKRMAIAAAGMYVELIIAVAATFLWWVTDPATFLHRLCLSLMVVCGINTLVFNINPLMRFDGYFILSDWLETPNLRDRANRYLRAEVLERLGIETAPEPTVTPARRILLVVYAVASYLYRWAVTFVIVLALYAFLEPHKLGAVAVVLGTAALATMIGWPVYRLAQAVQRQGVPQMNGRRLALAAGIFAVTLVILASVPLPAHVRGTAVIQVEPEEMRRVAVPESGGFLRELLVRDGQPVRRGDVLALLASPELESGVSLNEADHALRLEQRQTLIAEIVSPGTSGERAGQDLRETVFALQALDENRAKLRKESARLTIRAPCDGVVMSLLPRERLGRWLEHDTELCRVGDHRSLRAVLLVEPAERGLITTGSTALIRIHGRGGQTWAGTVSEIAQVEAKEMPPQLAARVGGEVASREDPTTKAEIPQNQVYLVAVRFRQADRTLQPGSLGRVKIEATAQTVWQRLRRYLALTFHWGL